MTTPMERKAKLKGILMELLTPEEKDSLTQDERLSGLEQKVNAVIKSVHESNETTVDLIAKLADAMSQHATKSGEGWNTNAAPLFRQMIAQIAGVNENTKKSLAVQSNWKFPQYSSVSVRNTNFSNINPAVDLFNIGSADDILLGYTGSNLTSVTYKKNGAVIGTLALSYSGSNLTEVQRTS